MFLVKICSYCVLCLRKRIYRLSVISLHALALGLSLGCGPDLSLCVRPRLGFCFSSRLCLCMCPSLRVSGNSRLCLTLRLCRLLRVNSSLRLKCSLMDSILLLPLRFVFPAQFVRYAQPTSLGTGKRSWAGAFAAPTSAPTEAKFPTLARRSNTTPCSVGRAQVW
jgi:hypothetical protein